MKKIILLILLVKFCIAGNSQMIKGTILDKKSGSPVAFATVYFNGTSVGSGSNDKGYFEIDVTKHSSMPLTISALGYYSVILSDYLTNPARVFYLVPKVYQLSEVVVKADPKSVRKAKKNFGLFKSQFLGQSPNASECEIKNDIDIRLTYDSDKGILEAFSFEPILIKNRSLGYDITYFLDKFEFNPGNNSLLILGNYIYKEDTVLMKSQKESIEKRRESAYLGSRMHFFKSLWENKLDSAEFYVLNLATNKSLRYKDLVIQKNTDLKYLKFNGKLTIKYKKTNYGTMKLTEEKAYFDKDGYFDPTAINWGGEMAKQRIGDQLPFGYKK